MCKIPNGTISPILIAIIAIGASYPNPFILNVFKLKILYAPFTPAVFKP